MSLSQLPLTLIVAATRANGIGKSGALPWPMLKKEMAYFARVTKRVPSITGTGSLQSDTFKQAIMEGQRKNAVIMGRKTWDSIPEKMRPLKERTNIVISNQTREQLGIGFEDVVVASSITTALRDLEDRVQQGKASPVSRAFIIGGSTIYKAALDMPQTNRVLLTQIDEDFDCDTFFPADLSKSEAWRQQDRSGLESYIQESLPEGQMIEEKDGRVIKYEFQLYEKC